MFPDVEIVREVQNELDTVIEDGVVNIVQVTLTILFSPFWDMVNMRRMSPVVEEF